MNLRGCLHLILRLKVVCRGWCLVVLVLVFGLGFDALCLFDFFGLCFRLLCLGFACRLCSLNFLLFEFFWFYDYDVLTCLGSLGVVYVLLFVRVE